MIDLEALIGLRNLRCKHCFHADGAAAYVCCNCGARAYRLLGHYGERLAKWYGPHGYHAPKIAPWF